MTENRKQFIYARVIQTVLTFLVSSKHSNVTISQVKYISHPIPFDGFENLLFLLCEFDGIVIIFGFSVDFPRLIFVDYY